MEERYTELATNEQNVKVSQKWLNKNTKEGFKKYFREYCENSSINGFKYLVEKRTKIERYVLQKK